MLAIIAFIVSIIAICKAFSSWSLDIKAGRSYLDNSPKAKPVHIAACVLAHIFMLGGFYDVEMLWLGLIILELASISYFNERDRMLKASQNNSTVPNTTPISNEENHRGP